MHVHKQETQLTCVGEGGADMRAEVHIVRPALRNTVKVTVKTNTCHALCHKPPVVQKQRTQVLQDKELGSKLSRAENQIERK